MYGTRRLILDEKGPSGHVTAKSSDGTKCPDSVVTNWMLSISGPWLPLCRFHFQTGTQTVVASRSPSSFQPSRKERCFFPRGSGPQSVRTPKPDPAARSLACSVQLGWGHTSICGVGTNVSPTRTTWTKSWVRSLPRKTIGWARAGTAKA